MSLDHNPQSSVAGHGPGQRSRLRSVAGGGARFLGIVQAASRLAFLPKLGQGFAALVAFSFPLVQSTSPQVRKFAGQEYLLRLNSPAFQIAAYPTTESSDRSNAHGPRTEV